MKKLNYKLKINDDSRISITRPKCNKYTLDDVEVQFCYKNKKYKLAIDSYFHEIYDSLIKLTKPKEKIFNNIVEDFQMFEKDLSMYKIEDFSDYLIFGYKSNVLFLYRENGNIMIVFARFSSKESKYIEVINVAVTEDLIDEWKRTIFNNEALNPYSHLA